jgi:hypothetical protein
MAFPRAWEEVKETSLKCERKTIWMTHHFGIKYYFCEVEECGGLHERWDEIKVNKISQL